MGRRCQCTRAAGAVESANRLSGAGVDGVDADALTARLRDDGYAVLDGPRRTGDGYYESVVLDPDGNRLELTAG